MQPPADSLADHATEDRHRNTLQMSDLQDAERLIIRVVRRWVQCLREQSGYPLAVIHTDLQDTFGRNNGRCVLPAFTGLTHVLWAYARTPFGIHWPCCTQVSNDERIIIHIIAACQAKAYADARNLAAEKLHIDGVPECLLAASRIAATLTKNGISLPTRTEDDPLLDEEWQARPPAAAVMH